MAEFERNLQTELGGISRSTSQFADDGGRLRNTKASMNHRRRQLEAKVDMQEKEIEKLRLNLFNLGQEEDNDGKCENQVFVDLPKRTSKAHAQMDQRLLDIIDSYENQISSLKKQLKTGRADTRAESFTKDPNIQYSSGHFKNLIRSYEKQLHEKDKKIKILEEQNEASRLNADSRLEMKDYRFLTQRVKKLERILNLHNISIPGERQLKDLKNKKKFSARLEDLDYLPVDQCHRYLQDLCAELESDNLDCLTNIIQEIKEDGRRMDRFQQYCAEFGEIVQSIDQTHPRSHYMRHNDRNGAVSLCDANMQYYLEVVDNWRKDIAALDELQNVLNLLLEKCVPWVRAQMDGEHTVAEMIETLERVIHADRNEKDMMMMQDVSRSTLEGIVSHFQTLFDVHQVSGVFPKMTDIYQSLGEVQNVQSTLKNILGLSEKTNSSVLVDVVGKLCHSHDSTTSRQLKKLMQTEDLSGIIRRLDEHNRFFPAFHGIMSKLFEILGVDQMEEVLPAVRALKLLAN